MLFASTTSETLVVSCVYVMSISVRVCVRVHIYVCTLISPVARFIACLCVYYVWHGMLHVNTATYTITGSCTPLPWQQTAFWCVILMMIRMYDMIMYYADLNQMMSLCMRVVGLHMYHVAVPCCSSLPTSTHCRFHGCG